MKQTNARILRRRAAAAYVGMSEPTFGRISQADTSFSRPIAISVGITGWDTRALDAWIDARPRLAPGERGLRGERTRLAHAKGR